MTSPVLIIVGGVLAIGGATAVLVAVAHKIVPKASGAALVVWGTLFAPVLWVLWGCSFLYTGTPSSDHDETLVYIEVSIVLALLTAPLSLAASLVTVGLLKSLAGRRRRRS